MANNQDQTKILIQNYINKEREIENLNKLMKRVKIGEDNIFKFEFSSSDVKTVKFNKKTLKFLTK